jgi:hypothetical protein
MGVTRVFLWHAFRHHSSSSFHSALSSLPQQSSSLPRLFLFVTLTHRHPHSVPSSLFIAFTSLLLTITILLLVIALQHKCTSERYESASFYVFNWPGENAWWWTHHFPMIRRSYHWLWIKELPLWTRLGRAVSVPSASRRAVFARTCSGDPHSGWTTCVDALLQQRTRI